MGAEAGGLMASFVVGLSPARREIDIGLFFRRRGWGDVLSTEGFVEWRHNAPHARAGPVVEAGIRLRLAFQTLSP
ncbi:hypothetical protein AB3X55_11140 [Alphaproteobacteria bacterium LSUCC0719]